MNQLNRDGEIRILKIAENSNFLQVSIDEEVQNMDLSQLSLFSEQVTWMDLSGAVLSDSALTDLPQFTNLTRLNLSQTGIGNVSLQHLQNLGHLEYLNLYGTNVDDEGLERLSSLNSLESLYLWQTSITDEGVMKLREQLPNVQIDTGWNSGI